MPHVPNTNSYPGVSCTRIFIESDRSQATLGQRNSATAQQQCNPMLIILALISLNRVTKMIAAMPLVIDRVTKSN